MKLNLIIIAQMIILSSIAVPLKAHAYFWTHTPLLEEGSPITCPQNHLMTGIQCWAEYCDNMEIECSGTMSSSSTSEHETALREWMVLPISEEPPRNQTSCLMIEPMEYSNQPTEFGVITGMSCKGKYCDRIAVECSILVDSKPDLNDCYWSKWVSEEDGGRLLFPGGYYAVGMECRGRYCDNKRFLLCSLRPRY